MNDDYKHHAQALIQRLLAEAHEDARANSYKDALVALRKAKALDATNIYILAFERQVEQLEELTAGGTVTDDQRNDILESIPVLIEQAHATQAPLATAETADAERHVSPEQQEQMRAARQWLKNQYFQRAHEHVRKHEYDEARAELRRVFVIDDNDLFAHQFEAKIVQLQELHRKEMTPASDRPESEEGSDHLSLDAGQAAVDSGEQSASGSFGGLSDGSEALSGAESTARFEGGVPAESVVPTESGVPTEPAVPVEAGVSTEPAESPESALPAEAGVTPEDPARKTNRLLTITLLIAIAVIAFAFYYFWKREQQEQVIIAPAVDETMQQAADDEPVYQIPSSIPVDSAAHDSARTPDAVPTAPDSVRIP